MLIETDKSKDKSKRLNRTTITTSRLMDFCSQKELTAQTGHSRSAWPLVILKELMDNALDAAEETGVAPEIEIMVDLDGIEVCDNAGGIPPETIEKVLDFTVRVSSREAYTAPDRGAQGNALKTLVMMPFVVNNSESGSIKIISSGVKHTINVKIDEIRQQPAISHKTDENGQFVKNGTSIRLDLPWSLIEPTKQRFLQMAEDYTFLNPHLTLTTTWDGEQIQTEAIDRAWAKWRPSDPTSAHWYELDHFTRLLGAYIARDQDTGTDRTVREVISEFRGLTATARQKTVLDETGLARVSLSALINDGSVDREIAGRLLDAMKKHTQPVKPKNLGVLGKDNLSRKFAEVGCDMKSFQYCSVLDDDDDGLPFVLETAFGWFGKDSARSRQIVTGVNWSPGILNPFRELGTFGESLDSILEQQRVGRNEPVVFLLHGAHPRVEYTDRGKSAVVIKGENDIEIIETEEDYE